MGFGLSFSHQTVDQFSFEARLAFVIVRNDGATVLIMARSTFVLARSTFLMALSQDR